MLPNRIGGARGPNGTTLDDLLLALQANTTAIELLVTSQATQGEALAAILAGINSITTGQAGLSAQLGALALATGSPSDTTCDMSQLELLCAIATVLGLETTPGGGAPPATCPGFPATPTEWLYSASWTGYWGESAPREDTYYPAFTEVGELGSVYTAIASPNPGVPEYVFTIILTAVDATNICISWNKPGTGYELHYNTWTYPAMGSIGQNELAAAPATGTGSESVAFGTATAISITVSSTDGLPFDPSGLEVWIVQGAFG